MTIKLTIISVDPESDNLPTIEEFKQKEITIGRGENNDLKLDQDSVSSKHAVIAKEDDNTLSIKDLGSANGTMIEGRTIEPNKKYHLKEKERIFIGDFLIKPILVPDKKENTIKETKEINELNSEDSGKKSNSTIVLNDVIQLENESQEKSSFSNNDLSIIFEDSTTTQIDISKIDNDIFELNDDAFGKENNSNNDNDYLAQSILEEKNSTDLEQENNINNTLEEIILNRNSIIEENKKEDDIVTILNSESHDDDCSLIISGTAGDETFNIDLEAIKLLKLKGRCKRFGKGIQDVIVALNDKKVISDKEGKFEFLEIEENSSILLTASKTGYIFEPKEFTSEMLEDTEVIFQGTKIFNILGKVIYKNSGLKDVKIINNLGKEIITSDDGSFVISNVSEGTKYTLNPQKENFIFEYDNEEKTLEDNVDIKIKAIKLITISGYIKYKGTPVSDVIIDGGSLGKTLTDDTGYYEFKNITEGTPYSLKAHKEGFVFKHS